MNDVLRAITITLMAVAICILAVGLKGVKHRVEVLENASAR